LSADEFPYYGLQQICCSNEQRKRYVGKLAQNRFHSLCSMTTWFSTAHDKLLLHDLGTGAGLPHPALRFARLKDAAARVAGQGSRVHLAILKIPDGTHEADNFWREGNRLAPIDSESGKLGAPVSCSATTLEEI
jgi:hypothetical protein